MWLFKSYPGQLLSSLIGYGFFNLLALCNKLNPKSVLMVCVVFFLLNFLFILYNIYLFTFVFKICLFILVPVMCNLFRINLYLLQNSIPIYSYWTKLAKVIQWITSVHWINVVVQKLSWTTFVQFNWVRIKFYPVYKYDCQLKLHYIFVVKDETSWLNKNTMAYHAFLSNDPFNYTSR
jgi:hypothetical protein